MKTQYFTATSINGYLADSDNSLEWLFQFGDIEQIEGVKDEYPGFKNHERSHIIFTWEIRGI